jgi:hypothetical protein
MWKEAVVTSFKVLPCTDLEGLRKITRHLRRADFRAEIERETSRLQGRGDNYSTTTFDIL